MTDLGAPANGNGHAEPPRAQRCETCMWFTPDDPRQSAPDRQGFCHRYPPMPLMAPQKHLDRISVNLNGVFAPTAANTFCGEWAEGPKAIEEHLEAIRAALRPVPAA